MNQSGIKNTKHAQYYFSPLFLGSLKLTKKLRIGILGVIFWVALSLVIKKNYCCWYKQKRSITASVIGKA